jgi:quercetin dioxygenase-like cupin family protein
MKVMKKALPFAILLGVALYNPAAAQDASIFPKGEKAPNVHHTGDVWLNHLIFPYKSFDYNVVLATFSPGAKLDWHIHPGGQELLITDGTGYYQERNKAVEVVRKGDVVRCLPGVEHWHAATPESHFAYLAITANQSTVWLEPVNDQEYHSIESTNANSKGLEEEIIDLSKKKWRWMEEQKVDALANLFHENSKFVHMGGTMSKEQELDVIKTGGIHYKKADIHEVSVNIIGNTAILLNRITLLAVVGGNEVTNPFVVTEVYVKENGAWMLGSLSFTRLLTQ